MLRNFVNRWSIISFQTINAYRIYLEKKKLEKVNFDKKWFVWWPLFSMMALCIKMICWWPNVIYKTLTPAVIVLLTQNIPHFFLCLFVFLIYIWIKTEQQRNFFYNKKPDLKVIFIDFVCRYFFFHKSYFLWDIKN